MDGRRQRIEEKIEAVLVDWQVPGAAVSVVKDGQVVLARGFGVRELGRSEPVDEHTLFAIASNTKAFTATAIAMLVEEKKLAWDDPVVAYLPGFQLSDPQATREITIRDLLCHRSGLPTWGGDLAWFGSNLTRPELLARLRFLPPAFRLGSGYGYSNLMFLAAGEVLQTVSGLPWEVFVQQRILDPLGMTRTTTTIRGLADLDNVAHPHHGVHGQLVKVPYRLNDSCAAAGALNSSAWDLAKWLGFQLNGGMWAGQRLIAEAILEETRMPQTLRIIPPETRGLVPTRHFSAYGLGWGLFDYQGRLVVSHDGELDGMRSLTGFLPEERLGVAVLTNRIPNWATTIVFYEVLDAFLGVMGNDWSATFRGLDEKDRARAAEAHTKLQEGRLTGTRPSLPLAGYTGAYANPYMGEARVSVEAGELALRLPAHTGLVGRMEHWHADTFLCRWSDPVFEESLVSFTIDVFGRPGALRFKVNEGFIDTLEYTFTRVDPVCVR